MTKAECAHQLAEEYAAEREKAEREAAKRLADVRARDPEIARLLDQNRVVLAHGARLVFSGAEDAKARVEAMRARLTENRAEVAARIAALGLPADVLEPRYRCPLCQDTSFVGEAPKTRCSCYAARLSALLFAGGRGEVVHSFENFSDGVYPTDAQRMQGQNAKRICERYAALRPSDATHTLLLMGESGLGKTFLLDAIGLRASQNGVITLSVTAFQAFEAMRAYHFGQDDEAARFRRILAAPLLLLDDLGTEPMMRNITLEYFFLLLNERQAANLHTAIATNLDPDALLARYGERVLSRLLDRRFGVFIRLTGEDLRHGRKLK